ncbi:hypothetical protein BASA81_008294 [Batrachochytrium salamandrivorans]|nr:hypothetical protein BASA81_008294 [Batrachochytrium salamandrivorans]
MQTLKKLDSNSDRWFKAEQDQMRRVHRVYRDSMREEGLLLSRFSPSLSQSNLDQSDSISIPTTTTDAAATTTISAATIKKADAESYLPRDSVLRSELGEMFKPGNCPFKDYDMFVNTLAIEYWRQGFTDEGHDRMLSEMALSLVSHICVAQAGKEMRVRHGSKPLGRYWRAKREHITPLALVMHELKLWSANRLRTFVVSDESTHVEIARRIKYVQGLQRKEVWGPSSSALQQGMRPIAHDKLFRLLLTVREDLLRARDFAFRGFCRRKSREKLAKLGNLLKNLFLNETRIVSLIGSFDHVVSESNAPQLQPTDLFNALHNQSFVDYSGNWVNVCLLKLCTLPLVQCALLGDFGGELDEIDPIKTIGEWSDRNLFCRRTSANGSVLLLDLESSMPDLYCKTYIWLGEEMRKFDKKTKQVPQRPIDWSIKMKTKVFALPSDALLVTETLMRYMAAMQDLVPCMYAVHELWNLSGEGGDFTLYDTLRQTVVLVMGDIIKRAYTLQCAQRLVFDLFENLSIAHQEAMESRRLKTKKAEYEPNWIANFRFVQNEYESQSKRGFAETFKQAQEVARDAWDYSLTKQKLDDKINRCKRMGEALVGQSIQTTTAAATTTATTTTMGSANGMIKGDFSLSKVVDLKRKDWMGIVRQQDESTTGSSQAFLLDQDSVALASESIKFKLEAERLDADENLIKLEFDNRRVSVMPGGGGGGGSSTGSVAGGGDLGGRDLENEDLERWAQDLDDEPHNPFRE